MGSELQICRPLNLKSDLKALGFEFKDKNLRPIHLKEFDLADVYLYTDLKGGYFFNKDLKPLPEVTDALREMPIDISEIKKKIKSSLTTFHGVTLSTLTYKARGNYCHFLLEGIPKLEVINSRIPVDNILCEESFLQHTKVASSCYERYSASTFSSLAQVGLYKFERLLITNSIKHPMHNGHPEFLKFHKKILNFCTNVRNKKYRKIFIDRPSGRRGIANKDELLSLLREYNIKPIKLENFSFLEQVEIFNSAKLIVGIHGAGLSNLVYSQKGTKVVELFQHDFGLPSFWYLANLMALDYYCVGEKNPFEDEIIRKNKFNDLIVNLSDLKVCLNSIESSLN